MRITTYCILLILIFINVSCQVNTDEFSFERENYSGNIIRTDGFYYQKFDDNNYSIIYYYRNGICIGPNGIQGKNVDEIKVNLENVDWESFQKVPTGWGIFKVNGNELLTESWTNPQDRAYPVVSLVGEINSEISISFIDDDLDDMKFEKSTFKPDSTNQWIE